MTTADVRRSVAAARARVRGVPTPATPCADDIAAAAPPYTSSSEVELFAYGEDCIVSGFLRLDCDRLSDALNDHERFELRDVVVTDLEAGTAYEVREIEVLRDDLLVAYATGPRGKPERRTRTRQHPVVVTIGPYEVKGYVHALPGADPIASIRRRRPMVALTDATIRYVSKDGAQVRTTSAVLINRFLAESIVPGVDPDDPLEDLELPVETGPLAKDFTGAVLGE